jgi:starvation-inducible outer membrane lipoprotein
MIDRCKEVNVKIFGGILILSWTMLSACAPTYKVFPPYVMEGVESNFSFTGWRMTPNESIGKKVQLGGRIMQAQSSGDTVTIVVSQLPIADRPAYGPRDTGKDNGQFVIIHSGKVEAAFLRSGNRIMVVGKTRSARTTSVMDIPKSLPAVQAECVHVWATGGREIEDFPHMEAGYVTLDEETACVKQP